MALPRELVDAMQAAGQPDDGATPGNREAAAALVGDFAVESASASLDRLLMLCDDGGDACAAAGLATDACDHAALLQTEVARFLRTASRI